MRACFILLPLLAVPAALCSAQTENAPRPAGDLPVTRAERTGFRETTRYTEVLEFLHLLERPAGPLRVEFFGATAEGRALPVAVVGAPPPEEPHDIDRAATTVVFIQANIHAGEVDGKEACLMLLREITSGRLAHLLDGIVLLAAPDFNADGNELISPDHRPRQDGPASGVGTRANAQNLDLNRDFTKIESPEVQAHLEGVVLRWDPDLLVDCHTTNGSLHEEPICYSWSLNPLGDPEVARFDRTVLLPWITERTLDRDGYASIPYGLWADGGDPSRGWRTFGHEPRYATNYWGLRNRHSVLIETYAYADFETRVRACFSFLQSILEAAARMGERLRGLVREADSRAAAGTKARFFAAFEPCALKEPVTIRGFEPADGPDDGHAGKPAVYTVPYLADFRPIGDGRPLPARGYVFPRGIQEARSRLIAHGVRIEEVAADTVAKVEVFEIEAVVAVEGLFQGHRCHALDGRWVLREVSIPAGSWFVPSAQPLGMLAAVLLEPDSDDGFAHWNLLDRYLTHGTFDSSFAPYPVWRW